MKTIDVNLVLGRPGTHEGGVDTAKELLEAMDRHDIERGFVTHVAGSVYQGAAGNALLFRQVPTAHERLSPVPVANLNRRAAEPDWDLWEKAGARGVRICPGFYGPTEPEVMTRFMEALAQRGWFLQVALRAFIVSAYQPSASISDAVAAAKLRDDVTVLVTGLARGNIGEARAALGNCKNIWLDVGNLTTGTNVPFLVEEGFKDRLVCGSGYGVSCITPFRDTVRYSGIPEEAQQAILHDNAARLFE